MNYRPENEYENECLPDQAMKVGFRVRTLV